jgi:cytochrome c-type biogenesis protein CcmF
LGERFEAVSRETFLLMNNVLLLVAAAAVLLGTLYPLFLDALGLGKISVGPPYFESVFVPLLAPAIFLMGIGPMTRWKQAALPDLAKRLRWAFGVALVTALLLPFTLGKWTPMIAFGLLLSIWLLASGLANLHERTRSRPSGVGLGRALRLLPRAFWGMWVAHLGVAVFITGVTLVKGYETELDVKMEIGDTAKVGGYVFRLDKLDQIQGPNYEATRGVVSVRKGERLITTMEPEKRFYPVQQTPMTEAAINTGFTRDLYVSLGEPVDNKAWVVRIYHKPFIDWIWGGAFIMAIGGILAISDRRYRLARREQSSPATAAATPVRA